MWDGEMQPLQTENLKTKQKRKTLGVTAIKDQSPPPEREADNPAESNLIPPTPSSPAVLPRHDSTGENSDRASCASCRKRQTQAEFSNFVTYFLYLLFVRSKVLFCWGVFLFFFNVCLLLCPKPSTVGRLVVILFHGLIIYPTKQC